MKEERIFVYGSSVIGLGGIILSMILSGLMSDSIHRRTAVETKEERSKRYKVSLNWMIFSSPGIIGLVAYYYFIK